LETKIILGATKMSKIVISDLHTAGELFNGSESFLTELTDSELDATKGGSELALLVLAIALLVL
jgi:hypothetical protein